MSNDENIFITTSLEITKVDVKDLQVGMYVSELDRPWGETSFLFQGFELKSTADIGEVQRQCNHVFIDVTKTKENKNQTIKVKKTSYSKGWLEQREIPKKKSSFTDEIHQAESVYSETSSLVKGFMEDVAFGRSINVQMAKKVVSDCVQSIVKSPDALMWLTQLKNADEYTSQHSMNVCIFAISLGRHISLSTTELEDIGLCGLMHDMGKMKIPSEILNKPGQFEPEELKIMQSHPTLGWKLLMTDHEMPGCAIDAAYGHHERMDGSGYPRGLTGDRIHPYTRMITIVDMYDAISSDRVYKKGRTHLEAINILTKACGTQLDAGLVIKFIECLGIYPPGNIVEMTSGEVAVIVEVHSTKRLKPKVTMLLDANKKRVTPCLVDLAKMSLDSNGNNYGIKRMVRPEEYHIDINVLYKMGLLQSMKTNHNK